jgi:hypothetical protein
MKYGVIHRGFKQKTCCLIVLNDGSMIEVNPDELPTDHRRKRVKGQPGSQTRDSIALYQEQLNMPLSAPLGSSVIHAMQSFATRNFTTNIHTRISNASVQSPLRDSGYASIDSAFLDSMRSSFGSLNLADPVDLKANCTDAEDGFVDFKVKATWRLRRSYVEKLKDTGCISPSS